MKALPAPVDWEVVGIPRVIDGDTADLLVRRGIGALDQFIIEATGVIRVRLVHLDTPERGEGGYEGASHALSMWLHSFDKDVDGGLRVVTQGKDAFGRYLGDVYSDADRAVTATEHMIRQGWPVWTG